MMKKCLIIPILFGCSLLCMKLKAQPGCSHNEIVVNHVDALTAVQYLLSGSSAEIVGTPILHGNDEHLGTFTGAGNYLDFNEGVVLATGNARHAESKNVTCNGLCAYTNPTLWDGTTYGSSQSFGSEYQLSNPVPYDDPDLDILSSGNQYNAAMLEFEFIPHSTELTFEFVFASEETLLK